MVLEMSNSGCQMPTARDMLYLHSVVGHFLFTYSN